MQPPGIGVAQNAHADLVQNIDIVVYSKNFKEHIVHLEQVFERLVNANLCLKPSKCHFAKDEIAFLGHLVSASGVTPDPNKVAALVHWLHPENVHRVRSFLGFANYYHRFIKEFATIAKPLTALTEKRAILNGHMEYPPDEWFSQWSMWIRLP